MWEDDEKGPPSKRDWADFGLALGRLAWQLVQLAGNLAFLCLQFFLAFLLGFGAVIAGVVGAARKRK